MIINSNSITFMDTTDTKKIDIHISSNHPTVQIYNGQTPTPNWENTPLELITTVYADSTDVTKWATFRWVQINGNESVEYDLEETTNTLRISNNISSTMPMIRYKCYVAYNNKSDYSNEITFSRISDGTSAPTVQAQYSIDGTDNSWEVGLDSDIHKYIRFSYDGGFTWTAAIKIAGEKGEDGRSISLKGAAYTTDELVVGGIVTLYSDEAHQIIINGKESGDSYLVDGYLCVYNGSQFICSGQLQGPKGADGVTYYLYIRYADDISGSGFSTSPDNKKYIGFYRTTLATLPANIDKTSGTWNWAKFAGEDAKTITLTGSAQVFKVDKSNVVSPAKIQISAHAENTTIPSSGWYYSTDGKTFTNTIPTGVEINGNTVSITGANIASNSISIKATDGIHSDIFTVYKVFDGADGIQGDEGKPAYTAFLTNESVAFVANSNGEIDETTVYSNIVVYKGTEKIIPTIGEITGLPDGMTITSSVIDNLNELKLTIDIADKATLGSSGSNYGSTDIQISAPIGVNLKLNWSKINSGAKGDAGVGVKSITEYYLATASNSGVTTSTSGWTTAIQTITADKKYLWNYEVITYTNNTTSSTTPVIIGVFGNTGATGKGIKSVTEYYLASTLSSGVTGSTPGWTTAVQTLTSTNKYLWNYELITYTDNTTTSINPVIIGVYGDKGDAGTPASLVDITPSALYFKSTSGKNGTFDPEYIYLYPRFQNITYMGWQYSTDGGSTWNNVSGANGLLVVSHNSIDNTLRISRTSTLYTDTVTSISFKCLTSNTSVYDVVSVAKIYDVVDLEIGGRNYIPNSDTVWSTPGTASNSAYGVYKNGLNNVYEQLVDKQLMISFECMIETTDDNNGRIQVYGTNGNPKYRLSTVRFSNIVPNQWQKFDTSVNIILIEGNTGEGRIEFYGIDPNVSKIHIRKLKLEIGNKATDWTPAPEDLIESSSNISVMLSNEAHIFEADLNGVALPSTIVLDVMGFKGATRAATMVGTITGIPSTGMTVSTSNNNTTNTKITIGTTTNLTSAIADYGMLTIPITVNGYTVNKIFSWAKSNDMSNLNIGGRNLLYDSTFNVGKTWSKAYGKILSPELDKPNSNIYHVTYTNNGTGAIQTPIYNSRRTYIKLNAGEPLTISYDVYADDLDLVGNTISTLRMSDADTGGTTTTLFSSTKTHLINAGFTAGKWFRHSFTYKPTTNLEGWLMFGLYVNVALNATLDFKFREIKIERGNKATDWTPSIEEMVSVTFQLYAPKGYLITKDTPEVSLETFAYDGSQSITGATFKWYSLVNDVWTVISDATETSLTLNKSSVLKSNVYKCEMTYKDKVYESTATVEDKTDIYESIMCISSNTRGNNCYWVLYTMVYTDAEEVDPLLGPISISAPSSPVSGDYWYAVDETNASVQLKKYDGTSWVNSTDTQSLSYYWDIVNNGSEKVPFGDHSKVQVVSCHDFTSTATLVCGVNNSEDGLLTQSSLSLTDASDPIVSDTQPTATVNGQIWIKPNDNGTYLMFIWDESASGWISSDMDSRSKVYTSRPSSYNAGDLWITASDTDHGSYLQGTLLQAQAYNMNYNEADWSPTLRYDQDLDNMRETLNNLSQYVTIASSGLRIAARDSAGNLSEFTSLFTSEALTFYQGSKELLILANNQLTAPKIVVEDELEVQGEIKLGDLKLIIESNGSFSFAVEK